METSDLEDRELLKELIDEIPDEDKTINNGFVAYSAAAIIKAMEVKGIK